MCDEQARIVLARWDASGRLTRHLVFARIGFFPLLQFARGLFRATRANGLPFASGPGRRREICAMRFLDLPCGTCAASGMVLGSTPEYASSAVSYTRGTVVVTGGDTAFADPTAATGPVNPIVGAGSGFPGLLGPFNPQFSSSEMVALGLGGSLTLQFAQPVAVSGTPQIGVFTSAGLVDVNFPAGDAGTPAQTFTDQEFGAERSAIVSVGSSLSDMHSLGRVVFSAPANYYSNVADETVAVAPPDAVMADFGKPFTQPLSAFDGQDYQGILNVLDADPPAERGSRCRRTLGISDIEFVEFSDPLWMLPDGSTAEVLQSSFGEGSKPADLFVDAANVIPEPGTAGVMVVVALAALRRRTRASRELHE